MRTLREINNNVDYIRSILEGLNFQNDFFLDDFSNIEFTISDKLMRCNKRLEVVENAITQILLSLEDIKQYPDYMNFIMENFHDTNQVDIIIKRISNIDTVNNTLTLEDASGLIPYSYYTLSDGVNSEVIQITSINRAEDLYSVNLASALQNSYNINSVRLYRSTTVVKHNQAVRSGVPAVMTWASNIVWQGLVESTPFTVDAAPVVSDESLYVMDSSIKITDDGYFCLSPNSND